MTYLYIKSLHIIFMVAWFAGLFYIVRLFIYHTEALHTKQEPARSILHNQLALMSRRLWSIIAWPSAILTLFFGVWLLYLQPHWLKMPFMHIKLTLVGLLYLYHFYCHRLFRKLQTGMVTLSSFQLRILNEVATLFLVSIVFLIEVRDEISWITGSLGIILLGIIMMIALKLYKRLRER